MPLNINLYLRDCSDSDETLAALHTIRNNQEKIMASVAQLTQATNDLQGSVNQAVSLLQQSNINPADLDPVLGSLQAMKAQLDQAVSPPPQA